MPRRSTGCEKCRQRKVKCDEARPHCRRCTNYGVQCPGYRPPVGQDLHFVDQTKHIVRRSASEFALNYAAPSVLQQNHQPGHFPRPLQLPNQANPYKAAGHGFLGNVQSPALLGTFLDMKSPIKRDHISTTSFSYQTSPPAVEESTSLFQVAIDGLCSSEIQAMYSDGIQMEPRSHYNMVSGSTTPHTNQDSIQAAIIVLAMCKLFDSLLRENMMGLQQISSEATLTRPTSEQNVYEARSAWHWYQNIRHTSIAMGFVKRRGVFLGCSEWLSITEEAAREDPYIDLLNVLAPLPALLERVDAIAWPEPLLEDLATLCKNICWIKKELDEWHYWRYVAPDKDTYTLVDSRDMVVFMSHFPNTIYRTVYSFSSAETCNQYQLFWLSQMLLDVTLLDIITKARASNRLRELRLGSFTERTAEDIQRNAYVSANHYCRSIPFTCAKGMASIGPVDLLLVTTAQRYFERSGHSRESDWCTRVHRILQSNSATLPGPTMLSNLQFASSQGNHCGWEPTTHNIGPATAPFTNFPHQEYFLGDTSFPSNSTHTDIAGPSEGEDNWFNGQDFSLYSNSEPIETMPMAGWYGNDLQPPNTWKSGANYSYCESTGSTPPMNLMEPVNRCDSSSPYSDYMILQGQQGGFMAYQ